MKIGSLFSGIGGIELGFESVSGFETSWFVECDKYAQSIIRKHWPDAVIYDDIEKISFKDLPRVDILTGGFPCQDISNAGKRTGITGRKSSLWRYYVQAISEIRPKYAFVENVAALTKRGLDTVLCDLALIGYDAEWYCLSAASVGAPHRRNRIFILAYPMYSRCIHSEIKEHTRERETFDNFGTSSNKMADTQCPRLEGCRVERNTHGQIASWKAEPELGRVADGIPYWVDRIRCLGNAVVPACAEVFAKAIKKREKMNH